MNTSNHQKYEEIEKNPVLRWLLRRLYRQVGRELSRFSPASVLDAGCGEGHALQYLEFPDSYLGIDLNPDCIAYCQTHHPTRKFATGSVSTLGLNDQCFDVVICLEVLEHLPDPCTALKELARVARQGMVLSVPWEPFFQAGNLVRGKYGPTLGNHPEHVQHWGVRGFRHFLEQSGTMKEIRVTTAGPWLVGSGRPLR